MKTLVSLFMLLALTGSCKKDVMPSDNACTTDNPVENVAWLNAMKTSLNAVCEYGGGGAILQGTYQQQSVYFSQRSGGPAYHVGFGAKLLDCRGQVVKIYTSNDYAAFVAEVTNQKELYVTHC